MGCPPRVHAGINKCVCARTRHIEFLRSLKPRLRPSRLKGLPHSHSLIVHLHLCLIQWKESEIERWNTCPGFGLCCFSLEGFGQISPHCLIGLECQGTLGVGKPNDLPVSSFHLSLHPTPCCRLISQSTACPLLESIL